MRVLLVEDEAGLRMTIAANLELEGIEVVEAENGQQALELAAAQKFDIVLSDVRMPGMSGVAMFEKLKAVAPDLPVVLMTAFALEEHIQQAIQGGVYTVLSKPFAIAHAVKTLERASRHPVVLVVDGAEEAASTTAALSTAGLRSCAVSDLDSAVRAVQDGNIDVCILDLAAPGLDGPAIVERVLATDPTIAIVAMSRSIDPKALAAVADAVHVFLRKPTGARELVETIAKARREVVAG
jgi:two-component system response regulator HydG